MGNEQAARREERGNAKIPKNNKKQKHNGDYIMIYSQLINMGFPEQPSMIAATKYPKNIDKAINFINKVRNSIDETVSNSNQITIEKQDEKMQSVDDEKNIVFDNIAFLNTYSCIICEVPVYVHGDKIEAKRFSITYSYSVDTLINDLLSITRDKIWSQYQSRSYKIARIEGNSFINPTDKQIYDWSTEYTQLQRKKVISYHRKKIMTMGLNVYVKQKKYVHKIMDNKNICKQVIIQQKSNQTCNTLLDAYKCPIYVAMMNKYEFSEQNLNHLYEFMHFDDHYTQKPECDQGLKCLAYKRMNIRKQKQSQSASTYIYNNNDEESNDIDDNDDDDEFIRIGSRQIVMEDELYIKQMRRDDNDNDNVNEENDDLESSARYRRNVPMTEESDSSSDDDSDDDLELKMFKTLLQNKQCNKQSLPQSVTAPIDEEEEEEDDSDEDLEVNDDTLLHDQCHTKLYRHTPINGTFKPSKDQNLAFNSHWSQNKPLYAPTNDDKIVYEYNEVDGYINALIQEVITNGFKKDLCLEFHDGEECKHTQYSILKIVDDKLNCDRHKTMGSPLRRDHMLAIILYTGCDCNYDLCKAQRKRDYTKWKWFDYCLYNAIAALSNQETGLYTVYSGLCDVKLKVAKKFVEEGYFNSYHSTSWNREIAEQFANGNGMVIDIDSKFRKNAVCCDVTWISKFIDEAEILMARNISGSGAFQCEILDNYDGIQTVRLSHSFAPINQYEDVVVKSYIILKKQINNDNNNKTMVVQPIHKKSILLNTNVPDVMITAKIHCLSDINQAKYDSSFSIKVKFSECYTMQILTEKAIKKLQSKFNPVRFTLNSIDNMFGDDLKENELDTLLRKPITDYPFDKLHEIYLTVCVAIYHHRVGKLDKITCPSMVKGNTNDSNICDIYVKMKYELENSVENLDHMQNYRHFVADYEGKPKCPHGAECKSYKKRLKRKGDEIDDECHMILYIHPPRRRDIKTKAGIHVFEVNKNISQNQALYKPTFDDEIKYEYNEQDGFLNALIDEIIVNKLEGELGEKDDDKYQLMRKVDYKLNCNRHKQMGSPLNRSEMLAIICYTETECYGKMTKCQRSGDFKRWKWFDYCLYAAIQKLGIREWGSYTLYSGHNGVHLNQDVIKNTFFKTYTSSSWLKSVAKKFASGDTGTSVQKKDNGMIMQIDCEFRESFGSICCDVSWISYFKDEREVLIARGIDNINNNFDMKVIEENNGIQTVLLTKATVQE